MSTQTVINLSSEDKRLLCYVAKALSSPERIDIASLVYHKPLTIQEIAQKLNLPQSTTSSHVSILEKAGIVRCKRKIIDGNVYKLCSIDKYIINVFLRSAQEEVLQVDSLEIPIGAYTDCYAEYPCGLISNTEFIGLEDELKSFYMLNKSEAQIIWMRTGFLEYRIPNILPQHKRCQSLTISAELCAEAPGFNENFPSDIVLTLNSIPCATFHSPGDYGAQRGNFTPEFWPSGLSQYGDLITWTINHEGVFVNNKKYSERVIKDFCIEKSPYIQFRFSCSSQGDAGGGLNLFGENAGNYNQGIILRVSH